MMMQKYMAFVSNHGTIGARDLKIFIFFFEKSVLSYCNILKISRIEICASV